MSFFFSFLSFSFKLRERERGYIKLGIRRDGLKVYLSFFLWWSSRGGFFSLLRANRLYAIFNTGLKKMASSCPRYSFVFFYPEYLALVLPATNPVQRLTFLIIYFRWREGVPTSVLGSQSIIWLLSPSPCQAIFLGLLDVTQVRLLSTDSLP